MKCAACKTVIDDSVTVDSGLYGSCHYLCEGCGDAEEKAVAEAETNDLPKLLATYHYPNDLDGYPDDVDED